MIHFEIFIPNLIMYKNLMYICGNILKHEPESFEGKSGHYRDQVAKRSR